VWKPAFEEASGSSKPFVLIERRPGFEEFMSDGGYLRFSFGFHLINFWLERPLSSLIHVSDRGLCLLPSRCVKKSTVDRVCVSQEVSVLVPHIVARSGNRSQKYVW
jgi:hypothetical protein